jgi:hypothetical protein
MESIKKWGPLFVCKVPPRKDDHLCQIPGEKPQCGICEGGKNMKLMTILAVTYKLHSFYCQIT